MGTAGSCIALPRAASRRATRGRQERGNPRNRERERNAHVRRAWARALSPCTFLLLEHRSQPTPAPLCGLATWPPALRLLHISRVVILSFDWPA